MWFSEARSYHIWIRSVIEWYLTCNKPGSLKWIGKTYKHSVHRLTSHFINKCLLMQISNEAITWQQLSASEHVDMVNTTC